VATIAEHRRFDLRKPLVAAALVVCLLMTIYGTDVDWLLYAAVVGVLGGVGLLGSIALRAVFRKGQQRLESHWYAVTFYTEESWGERNRLNCSGSAP
jgi:hypothetical protein